MSQPMPEPRPDLLPAEPQDWELVADAFPGSLLFCDEAWVIQRAHGRADPVGHLDSQHYQGGRAATRIDPGRIAARRSIYQEAPALDAFRPAGMGPISPQPGGRGSRPNLGKDLPLPTDQAHGGMAPGRSGPDGGSFSVSAVG